MGVILTLCGFLCFSIVVCLNAVYQDYMPKAATDFRKSVKGILQADILEKGYSYTGDCKEIKRPDVPGKDQLCTLDQELDRVCRYDYYQELPTSVRRLSEE